MAQSLPDAVCCGQRRLNLLRPCSAVPTSPLQGAAPWERGPVSPTSPRRRGQWKYSARPRADRVRLSAGLFSGELPECTQELMIDVTKSYYQKFLPLTQV